MDGVSITIDGASIAMLMFLVYKVVQLEYRVKRIERILRGEEE